MRLLLLLALAACSGPSDPVRCGSGTELRNGVCELVVTQVGHYAMIADAPPAVDASPTTPPPADALATQDAAPKPLSHFFCLGINPDPDLGGNCDRQEAGCEKLYRQFLSFAPNIPPCRERRSAWCYTANQRDGKHTLCWVDEPRCKEHFDDVVGKDAGAGDSPCAEFH